DRRKAGATDTQAPRADSIRLLPAIRGSCLRREARKGAGMPGTESDRHLARSMSSAISTAVVALLGEYTGRGPTKARTHINEDLIIVVLYDMLTAEERDIVRSGGVDLVLATRKAFQKAMKPELIAI